MSEFVFPLITLAITLIVIIVVLLVKLHQQDLFFERIHFCVAKKVLANYSNCYIDLVDLVNNVQSYSEKKYSPDRFFPKANLMAHIDSVYRIAADERDMANKIICTYQKSKINDFFEGNLKLNQFVCKLSPSEYFILTLYYFLEDNEYKRIFEEDLYVYTHSDDMFRCYELTDFGIVYYKLLLISNAYSVTINISKYKPAAAHMIKQYKEILDTKTIKFYK